MNYRLSSPIRMIAGVCTAGPDPVPRGLARAMTDSAMVAATPPAMTAQTHHG